MAGLGGLTRVLIRNNHLGSPSYSCSCGSAEDGSLKLDPCSPLSLAKPGYRSLEQNSAVTSLLRVGPPTCSWLPLRQA